MSRWRLDSNDLIERDGDYTAQFTCTNVDTDKQVKISLQQNKGDPASDLVGALRALAQLMVRASGSDKDLPDSSVQKLN